MPVDTSNDHCCELESESTTGLIVGVIVGSLAVVLLVLGLVYWCVFRNRRQFKLEETYGEIFAKFTDFDQTRVRTDS